MRKNKYKKVLIFGGTGFLGNSLIKLLEKMDAKIHPKITENPIKMMSKSVFDALWDGPGPQLGPRPEKVRKKKLCS